MLEVKRAKKDGMGFNSIALTRNSLSDFCTCNYVPFFFVAFFFFCSGEISDWYSLYSAVENMCRPRALQMKSPAGGLPYERGGDARRLV